MLVRIGSQKNKPPQDYRLWDAQMGANAGRQDEELCKVLLTTGSLRFGTFKLASGILSPYYVDLRLIPSHPEALRRTVGYYSSILEKGILKRVDRIAGVPTAGIAYGAILAFNLGKPFIYIRKEAKDHGRGRKIEGVLRPGDRVLVVDDVATTGSSLLVAIGAIRSEGGLVEDVIVLLDRQQGGEANLKKTGVRLHSFSTMHRIAGILLEQGTIDERQHREIVSQITT